MSYNFRWVLEAIGQVIASGSDSMVLDFRQIRTAHAACILPLICIVEGFRHAGMIVSISLPTDSTKRHLFVNTNWAHYLDPSAYPHVDISFNKHLSVRRFRDSEEQRKVVNDFMDVVLRTIDVKREPLRGLEWSINEITDNVLNHANAPGGGFVQVTTLRDGQIYFTVADGGRGILASLREAIPDLPDDMRAIGEAVRAGVTRDKAVGQGNGLAGTLRVATLSGGTLEITSGKAQLVVADETKTYSRPESHDYTGTVVNAGIGTNPAFTLAEAIGFKGYAPISDIIEINHDDDATGTLVLRLKTETTGTGTRPAGRQIRTKCINLLNAEPTKALTVDWEGLPTVASSFADEAFGKLFVKMGPLAFGMRVRHVNLDAVVQQILEKAIMQRVAQTMAGVAGVELDDEQGDDADTSLLEK